MSNKWEMFGSEVTGSLFDIDYEFMARVHDDCNNKKWLACPSCRWHFEEALRIKSEEIDKLKQDIEELKSKNIVLRLCTVMNPSCYGLYGVPYELNEKIKALEKENKELKDKDKLIEELKQKIEALESKNKELSLRTIMTPSYYDLYNVNVELNKKIKVFEKENEELKDTLEKDKEFGKYVGKLVADSIEEGWKRGAYELHPSARIDIHVEETNNMPTTFDRHAIPRIAIMFNNTQTEMERDTAQHECEELHEKIDSLWRVNDELNRKIKALEKENKGLKRSIAWFNDNI